MKRLMRSALVTAVLLIASIALQSVAYADGLYAGLGAYRAEYEDDIVDDDETVPAAFIGYNFLDTNILMLSAELGYYQLADFEDSIDLGRAGNVDYEIDAKAFTLAAVVYVPIGPFIEIYAKAGIAAVSLDIEINDNKFDEDGEEGFAGLGIGFDLFDTIDIYAEYLGFDTEIDSEMVGIGVRLDF